MRIQNCFAGRYLQSATRCYPFCALLILWLYMSCSYADLMINPTRIVLDEKAHNGQLELLNNGDTAITYRIRLIRQRMDTSGKFMIIDDKNPALATENFADQLVRFSPRQVTLQPGKSQIIRIMLHKAAGLAEGEYRSHLLLEQVPDTNVATSIDKSNKPDQASGVSIQLTALFGASIPIIVRQGALNLKLGLSELRFLPAQGEQLAALALTISRSGTRSAYGDLVVHFHPDGSDKAFLVGRTNGLAVYTPNDLRYVSVSLKPEQAVAFTKGKLVAQFFSQISEDSKLLAEASLYLP